MKKNDTPVTPIIKGGGTYEINKGKVSQIRKPNETKTTEK